MPRDAAFIHNRNDDWNPKITFSTTAFGITTPDERAEGSAFLEHSIPEAIEVVFQVLFKVPQRLQIDRASIRRSLKTTEYETLHAARVSRAKSSPECSTRPATGSLLASRARRVACRTLELRRKCDSQICSLCRCICMGTGYAILE